MDAGTKDSAHLDLGCGYFPRNPYGRGRLYGVDVMEVRDSLAIIYAQANLAVDPIPFEDDFFDSISSFDFLEHIPRQAVMPELKDVRFPFIELMNEIWRTLKDGGLFYALTPAFPSPEAFQDPTHVNIITEQTHSYFCGDPPSARRYGFRGQFEVVRVKWTCPKNAYTTEDSIRKALRNLHRKYFRGGLTHILWELRARKKGL